MIVRNVTDYEMAGCFAPLASSDIVALHNALVNTTMTIEVGDDSGTRSAIKADETRGFRDTANSVLWFFSRCSTSTRAVAGCTRHARFGAYKRGITSVPVAVDERVWDGRRISLVARFKPRLDTWYRPCILST